MATRTKFCEDAAARLFAKSGASVPVDVYGVAAGLGLSVEPRRSMTGSGLLVRDQKRIYVPKRESLVRVRFSIAHELGHYCLSHDADVVDRADEETLSGRPVWEIEADRFAGALLMPRDCFRADFGACPNLESLASRYQVSTQAATIRAVQLNLV